MRGFGMLGLAALAPMAVGACASAPPRPTSAVTEIVLANDAGPAEDKVVLASNAHESLSRFDLPAGEHRLLRVRLQAAAAGKFLVTLYANNPLDGPGESFHSFQRAVDQTDVSDGKDGRWLVDDLSALGARSGTVWIGVRKLEGEPTLWTARGIASERTFLRSSDPANPLGMMAVSKVALVRLELAP